MASTTQLEKEDAKRSDHSSLLPLSIIFVVCVVGMVVWSGFAQLMLQKFGYYLSEQERQGGS